MSVDITELDRMEAAASPAPWHRQDPDAFGRFVSINNEES